VFAPISPLSGASSSPPPFRNGAKPRATYIGLVEAGIVLTARLGDGAQALLSQFLTEFGIVTVPFGDEHRRASVDAYRRFGRGRHKARLNFRRLHELRDGEACRPAAPLYGERLQADRRRAGLRLPRTPGCHPSAG
jgi:hypothetical protein